MSSAVVNGAPGVAVLTSRYSPALRRCAGARAANAFLPIQCMCLGSWKPAWGDSSWAFPPDGRSGPDIVHCYGYYLSWNSK